MWGEARSSYDLFSNIPPELTALHQWVVWKLEDNGKPKLDKVPYNPRTGQRAKSNDPATWGTFTEALTAYQRGGFDGIGFVFAEDDPYTGIDLDSCRNLETARLEPWAEDIVDQLASYTEASPSGTGIHIIVRATLPSEGRKNGKVEMYESGRFFTTTGEHIGGTLSTVENRQEELTVLHARIFSAKEHARQTNANGNGKVHSISDEELLALARRAKNGDLFARLFAGDWTGYPSQSEGDQALCNMLAFYCGPDPARISRLFQQSGLYRQKWDEKHFSNGTTYGEATVEKALSGTQEFYKEKEARPDALLFRCTDLGNAERLIARHGRDLLFCNPWNKWLVWDGKRWRIDNTQQARQWARATVRTIYEEAEKLSARAKSTMHEEERLTLAGQAATLLQHATRSEAEIRLNAMIHNAQMDVPILPEQLDTDPWLLTVGNGTLDLRTGELLPYRREDLLTKLIPIVYKANATAQPVQQRTTAGHC